MPFQLDPNTTDQGHYFQVAGRLKPGVTLDQAQARLKVSATEFRARFPDALQPNESFSVELMQDEIVRERSPHAAASWSAPSASSCSSRARTSPICCSSEPRAGRREIAIRAAIGAGRGRIIRQLLTESVVLSLAGGLLGLVLGMVGIRALLAMNTAGLPRVGEDGSVVVDWTGACCGFTLLVSIGTGMLFGLIPGAPGRRART